MCTIQTTFNRVTMTCPILSCGVLSHMSYRGHNLYNNTCLPSMGPLYIYCTLVVNKQSSTLPGLRRLSQRIIQIECQFRLHSKGQEGHSYRPWQGRYHVLVTRRCGLAQPNPYIEDKNHRGGFHSAQLNLSDYSLDVLILRMTIFFDILR